VGENVWSIEGDPQSQEFVALALSTGLALGFGVMAEGYSFTDAAPIAARDGGLLAAVSYSPKPWLVFDLGVDIGLIHATRIVSVFAGMTVVPVRFWGK